VLTFDNVSENPNRRQQEMLMQRVVKDEDYLIITDKQRLMQVLLGLYSNALKFTENGKVEIFVRFSSGLDESASEISSVQKNFIEISVIDTGVGIEQKDQDKLFKLFGFIQGTQQMNTKGIGLGLVISDQIVSQFNGDITFQSKVGEGSNFTFKFQLCNED
jgi:signal transduction histidine kinase